MKGVYLTVVIPCFDEMANLRKGVLEKVSSYLKGQKYSFEVVIVDDGSKDGSVEYIQNFIKNNPAFRLIKNTHTGKAGAVTRGMLSGSGEVLLFTDMDQATPIEELEKILPFFSKVLPHGRQGYDVVIGSRSTKRQGAPLIRQFVSRANIILRKIVVGIHDISDTQCGFKAFKREVALDLFQKVDKLHNGFRTISGSSVTSGFDVELLYLAEKTGYKIKEVTVKWLYVETRRVNPVKDSIDGVMELLKIRMNQLNGRYDNL